MGGRGGGEDESSSSILARDTLKDSTESPLFEDLSTSSLGMLPEPLPTVAAISLSVSM